MVHNRRPPLSAACRPRMLGAGAADGATRLPPLEYMVPESRWTPDRASSRCQVCGGGFSLSNRKHHCRRCGLLVCHPCSEGRARLCGLDNCRVCNACRDETRRLADFERTHRERLSANVAFLDGSESFERYEGGPGRAPRPVEVWLSADAMLVCVRDAAAGGEDTPIEAMPVHLLESVESGIQTAELRGRTRRATLCCESEDAEFVSRGSCMLSLCFRDGSTLDLEAAGPKEAAAWVRRFRALASAVAPYAAVRHEQEGGLRTATLVRAERTRLRQLRDRLARDERRSRSRTGGRRKSAAIRSKYQRMRDTE